MTYEIIPTPKFEKDIKFYKKKFKHVIDDLKNVIEEIGKGNFIGDAIDDIGLPQDEDAYKARCANVDTRVGKSNGYRLIYYVVKNDTEVYLLTIYYKKDDKKIPTKQELIKLIKKYCV